MKPRLRRTWCDGFFFYVWFAGGYAWRCEGAGLVAHGWTPELAYRHWAEDYNQPLRRALRWLKDLRKGNQ